VKLVRGKASHSGTGERIWVEGGAVTGEAIYFDEMHVHVGKTDTTGSEHLIDGKG
jgi:hypothetical protein